MGSSYQQEVDLLSLLRPACAYVCEVTRQMHPHGLTPIRSQCLSNTAMLLIPPPTSSIFQVVTYICVTY